MIRFLQDVPELDALEFIARQFRVVLTLHGSLARRLLAHEVLSHGADLPSLFQLTPFTSAITLSHSGAAEHTRPILQAIQRNVPMAECFRWRLRSIAEQQLLDDANRYSALVPVNAVRLSTDRGFDDPAGAQSDLMQRRYRFMRNPRYLDSPAYRSGVDLEVFAALRYLQAVFEDPRYDVGPDADLHVIAALFADAQHWHTLSRLQESAALRERLHNLLMSVNVHAASAHHSALIDKLGVRGFVAFIDGPAYTYRTPNYATTFPTLADVRDDYMIGSRVPRRTFSDDLDLDNVFALTSSERIEGDLYRFPQLMPFTPSLPEDSALDVLRRVPGKDSSLAEDIDVVKASTWIQILPGPTRPSSAGPLRNEFFHLAIVERTSDDEPQQSVADEDYGILLTIAVGGRSPEIMAPLASCISRPYRVNGRHDRLLLFRVSCGSAFDKLPTSAVSGLTLVSVALAARNVTESPPEADPSETFRPMSVGGKDLPLRDIVTHRDLEEEEI